MRKVTPNDTAILIFAKSAKSESKRIIDNGAVNRNLLSVLNSNIESIARQSGLPYFLIDEHKQVGNDFGERLGNAFEHVYALGFKHVIAVGNDCPTLTANDLKSTYSILKSGKTVIGPDARGGVYLLGISKSNFSTSVLQNSKWQHKNTFSQLQKIFDSTYILRARKDINDKKDFQSFLRKSYDYELLSALHEALSPKSQFNDFEAIQKIKATLTDQIVLRGPPIFFA